MFESVNEFKNRINEIGQDLLIFGSNLTSKTSVDDSGIDSKGELGLDDRVTIEDSSSEVMNGKKVEGTSTVNISVNDYLNSSYAEKDPLQALNNITDKSSDGPLSHILGVNYKSHRLTSSDTLELVKRKMVDMKKMGEKDSFITMSDGKVEIRKYNPEDEVKFKAVMDLMVRFSGYVDFANSSELIISDHSGRPGSKFDKKF